MAMNHSFRSRLLAAPAVIAVAGMVLAGCQTTGTSLARYNDANDRCATYRQPLIETENELKEPIIAGAAVGAVATGLAVGMLTGNWRAGVGSAIAGGLVGAAAGYYNAKEKEARNQRELLAAIDGDAQKDATRFSRIGSSVKSLRTCREQQIAELKQKVVSKQITVEQARAQRDQIAAAIQQDGELMNAVLGQADSRVDTYVQSRAKALGTTDTKVALGGLDVGATRTAQAARTTAVYSTADGSSPTLATLKAKQSVSAGGTSGGWTAVSLPDGTQGYVRSKDLSGGQPQTAAPKNGAQAAVIVVAEVRNDRQAYDAGTKNALDNLSSVL